MEWTTPTSSPGGAHASSHQTGGNDLLAHQSIPGSGSNTHAQIDSGLSAAAGHADAAAPHTGHAASTHSHAASDITGTAVLTADSRLSDARTPTAHAASHKSAGGDAIKLDELAATTDVTTLNASASAHGLCPKLSGSASQYLNGSGAWSSPAGGSTPAWHGAVNAAWGDGDPQMLLREMLGNPVNATPTNITASVARCAFFRLPANLTVNKIRAFGVGATTNIYRCAIYRKSDLARLTSELVFSTTAQAWVAIGSGLGLALTAGELYFIAVAVNTTGTTAGLQCIGGTTGRIGVLPTSWPGNLDIDIASPIIQPFGYCQFAVTTGALPATAAALAAQAAWTGGMPAFFLDANNA
jgi:hypothetical protein